MNRTKLGGIEEAARKMDEVREMQAHNNTVLEVARMTREDRVKYYDGMRKGPAKEEFQEKVEEIIHRIDLGEVPEHKPVFKTADEVLAEEYEEDGGADNANRRMQGLPCCQACCMYSCYLCCLQCPGMKELYQVWTYRACFYICFSIAMFAYKVTTTTGIMLVVIGVADEDLDIISHFLLCCAIIISIVKPTTFQCGMRQQRIACIAILHQF